MRHSPALDRGLLRVREAGRECFRSRAARRADNEGGCLARWRLPFLVPAQAIHGLRSHRGWRQRRGRRVLEQLRRHDLVEWCLRGRPHARSLRGRGHANGWFSCWQCSADGVGRAGGRGGGEPVVDERTGGWVLSGRVVTWMSSDGSVAIVNGSGLVTAVAPGQATITATSEGKSGSAAITVASPSGGGTVLLQENFDDPAFGVRGWYDNTRMTLSTVEHLLGSTGSLEIRFAPRATQPVWGSAARHLFQPTETVYLSYWVKYSANWVGSGHAYHPHEFYLMTTENGPEDGPSVSHLTVYVEDNYQGGIYPVLNSQDGQNIDQQRIGIDLTAITENRASCGCNGNTDGYATDCYDMGGGTRDNGKLWKTTTPALAVNRWQHVEAYFKLNSIQNGKGVSDGIVRYWVDGRLVIDHSDVLLRTGAHPTMKFNQLLIGPYIGDGSPVDQSLWVDNLTVATNKP